MEPDEVKRLYDEADKMSDGAWQIGGPMSHPDPREDGYSNVHPAFKDALAMVRPDPIMERSKTVENLAFQLGRQQMANEVLKKILEADKTSSEKILEVIKLCSGEVK